MNRNIVLTAVLFLIFSCNEKENTGVETIKEIEKIQYVKTSKIKFENGSETTNVLGIVTSKTQSTPSFKTGGVIDKTYVKEGSFVQKDMLLATLLMTEIDAKVNQANDGLVKAKRDLARVENLFADSVATLEQIDNARTFVSVSEKTLEIAHFNQKYSQIHAPIAGKVIKQLLHEGEMAGPGMPVFAILGISKNDWVITANLIDRDWAKVKKGDLVKFNFDAYPGKSFKGKVSKKSIIADETSGALKIEFVFKSNPPDLAAGMIARVEINTKLQKERITIPIDALIESNGDQASVFVVKDGKAKKIPVEILELLGDKVSIAAGLENIKSVITLGNVFLKDGDKVKSRN